MTPCPLCDDGRLTDRSEQMPVKWEGRSGFVTLLSSACDSCGSEIVDSQQATANKIAVLEFRNG